MTGVRRAVLGVVVIAACAAAPITVHIEDESGRPYVEVVASWVVNGFALPVLDLDRMFRRCGQSATTDAEGNLTLRGLPRGNVAMVDPETRRPVASFVNDGTGSLWTIRIPRGNNPRDATASPAR